MKLQVFAVYDGKSKLYGQPFYDHNSQTAMRRFGNAVKQAGHAYNSNPEDYTLFHLAELDDETGMFSSLTTPEPLVKAQQLVE